MKHNGTKIQRLILSDGKKDAFNVSGPLYWFCLILLIAHILDEHLPSHDSLSVIAHIHANLIGQSLDEMAADAVLRFRFNHTKCLLLIIIINSQTETKYMSFTIHCMKFHYQHLSYGYARASLFLLCYFLFLLMPDNIECVTSSTPAWNFVDLSKN